MPAPSKSRKKLRKASPTNRLKETLKADAHVLGVLARAINAVENCLTEDNREENIRDTECLREMVLDEADAIYSKWNNAFAKNRLKSHQILTVLDAVMEDAGWDYNTFCVNRDEKDARLLTWYIEE